jgi:uncharacterized protein DUF5372
VRIIWPHHPLYQQRVPLVELWEGSGRRRFVIELPDGSHTRIPAAWADNGDGAVPDHAPASTAMLSRTAVSDLVTLLDLLRRRTTTRK